MASLRVFEDIGGEEKKDNSNNTLNQPSIHRSLFVSRNSMYEISHIPNYRIMEWSTSIPNQYLYPAITGHNGRTFYGLMDGDEFRHKMNPTNISNTWTRASYENSESPSRLNMEFSWSHYDESKMMIVSGLYF